MYKEGKPNARGATVCFVLDLHKNVRCFRIFLENVIQEGVGRDRKIVDVEHETVHGAQAKMHPVKQDQEVIFLYENLEVVHLRQTGVIILKVVNRNGSSLDGCVWQGRCVRTAGFLRTAPRSPGNVRTATRTIGDLRDTLIAGLLGIVERWSGVLRRCVDVFRISTRGLRWSSKTTTGTTTEVVIIRSSSCVARHRNCGRDEVSSWPIEGPSAEHRDTSCKR